MKVCGLLKGLDHHLFKGSLEVNIKNIVNDSRLVEAGSLFVCIDGFTCDGHQYIETAIKKGAKAILVQKEIEITEDVTVVGVKDTRIALSHMASIYYNHPSEKFNLIGITGTNGKTSIVFLIKNILEAYGKKTGVIGTIENRIGEQVIATSRTTPESIDLQHLFSEMVEANVNTVLMEVSSHALDLHRVDHTHFDIGVFTNLSLDHLDYHKTMERYRDAKLKLFHKCPIGIMNLDDQAGVYMIEKGTCTKFITYGCENSEATLNAFGMNVKITGTQFSLTIQGEMHQFDIQTPGKFSVYNALAAIGVSLELNIPVNIIKKTLKEKSRVKGRFETYTSPNDFYAVVDYAHSPDGLENVLNTINEIAEAKIITVFGCGGDRDRSKRPVMGKIAGEKSDFVVITSDNPRNEDPQAIIKEIESGIIDTKCPYNMEVNRERAIHKALSMAQKGDIVLIAGKGHEDYQTIGNQNFHFDDSEKVLNFFKG